MTRFLRIMQGFCAAAVPRAPADQPVRSLEQRQYLVRIVPPAVVLFTLVFSAVCSVADQPIGQVTNAHGMATINRPGVGNVLSAGRGVAFFIGDVLETGTGSTAQVTFSDGSFVNLAPASSLRINQYDFDEAQNRRTLRSRLISGTARFVAYIPRGRGSLLLVESGSAVITASSLADFAVNASPGASEVVVLGHRVSVRNASSLVVGDVSLGSNQRTVVRGKTPPSQPDIITPEERRGYAFIVR